MTKNKKEHLIMTTKELDTDSLTGNCDEFTDKLKDLVNSHIVKIENVYPGLYKEHSLSFEREDYGSPVELILKIYRLETNNEIYERTVREKKFKKQKEELEKQEKEKRRKQYEELKKEFGP